MDIIRIAKQSLSTIRSHKYLLFFGFFVASGGGAGANPGAHGHHGGPLPAWIWPLLAGALVLGLAALVMHVLSEAALIDGVERAQHGERGRIGEELRASRRHFWTLAAIKLALGAAMVLSVGVVALPIGGALAGAYPVLAGAVATALLALVAVPWLLTLYFIYMYAMRIAVLDDKKAMDSIRAAKRYLHGRIASSLTLLVAGGLGAAAVEIVGVLVALPIAALGLGVYFLAGLVPALVVGGVLVLPVALVVAGSVGAYRSSLWTLGFLDGRGAA
jgi:hypothetical protein